MFPDVLKKWIQPGSYNQRGSHNEGERMGGQMNLLPVQMKALHDCRGEGRRQSTTVARRRQFLEDSVSQLLGAVQATAGGEDP